MILFLNGAEEVNKHLGLPMLKYFLSWKARDKPGSFETYKLFTEEPYHFSNWKVKHLYSDLTNIVALIAGTNNSGSKPLPTQQEVWSAPGPFAPGSTTYKLDMNWKKKMQVSENEDGHDGYETRQMTYDELKTEFLNATLRIHPRFWINPFIRSYAPGYNWLVIGASYADQQHIEEIVGKGECKAINMDMFKFDFMYEDITLKELREELIRLKLLKQKQ
jgi:hypothetical protein